MRIIDIWNDILRERGVADTVLKDAEQFADRVQPMGAEIARLEVPDNLISDVRVVLEHIIQEYLFKMVKPKQ